MSRVAFAVLFIWAGWDLRFALIIIAGITDFLDGWVARLQRISSRWGALIDPLSDRFFVFTAICVYLFVGVIETWHYFAFLLRDIMTAVGFVVAKAMPSLRVVDFRARWSGKVVTVAQIVVLLAVPLRFMTSPARVTGGSGAAWLDPRLWFADDSAITDWLFIAMGLASLWSVVDYTVALQRARVSARANTA